MKLYAVTYGFIDEPSSIAAIYSNPELAEQLVDFMRTDGNWKGYDFYHIDVYELDSKEFGKL